MYKKWLDLLVSSPLFKGIPGEELNTTLECLRPGVKAYKKNEFIALAGRNFEGLGIMLSGEAAITKETASGSRMIMTLLEPGGMFGEMAAFSGMKVWPATVIAQNNCSVLFLAPEKIVGECPRMCTSHRLLITNMLKIVSNKALMLNRKLEYLTIPTLRGKICSFFLEQYKKTGSTIFMMPMKRNELADFLNVSRPSLSREMSRMRDEGIIEFHMSSIKIKDLESLKTMAD